jgi:mono/diheme cytochrome c family protein
VVVPGRAPAEQRPTERPGYHGRFVRRFWSKVVVGLAVLAGIAGVLAGVGVAGAWTLYPRAWDRPFPAVRASADRVVIERGRYIVYGPGRCADCHTPESARPVLNEGGTVPLTGGSGEQTFLGTWSAPNLTPDMATGIGAVSDGQLARMMRYGVDRDGHIALPFMDPFADMTDADLAAVLSFLRSQPPASGVPPSARVNLLGRLALVYFIEPYAPSAPPRAALTPAPTAAYGEYLARALAGCGSCHTARSLRTGAYLSPRFSGGLAFRSRLHPDLMYVSPNLTPDSATGHIAAWTEDDFVLRFRRGAVLEDSPMPWGGFRRMTDTDLRALYRFFRTLPAVRHDVGPTVQPAHGQIAG